MRTLSMILAASVLCAFSGSTQAHQTDMSKQAQYHQQGKPPLDLQVLKLYPDKTVDLGNAAGELVVGKCEVSKDATPGTCTLVTAKREASAAKPDLKALKASLAKLTQEAEDAVKASDAAPDSEPLMQAALAAQAAHDEAAAELAAASEV